MLLALQNPDKRHSAAETQSMRLVQLQVQISELPNKRLQIQRINLEILHKQITPKAIRIIFKLRAVKVNCPECSRRLIALGKSQIAQRRRMCKHRMLSHPLTIGGLSLLWD